MKLLVLFSVFAFCSTSFGESAVLKNFMGRECRDKAVCVYSGQVPSVGLEVDGRKVLAAVDLVSADYVALSNIRVMSSRGWSRFKSGEWYAERAKKADAFCQMALGKKFVSHEHLLKGGSPEFKKTNEVSNISCVRKGFKVADLPAAVVIHRNPLTAELKRATGSGNSNAKR